MRQQSEGRKLVVLSPLTMLSNTWGSFSFLASFPIQGALAEAQFPFEDCLVGGCEEERRLQGIPLAVLRG